MGFGGCVTFGRVPVRLATSTFSFSSVFLGGGDGVADELLEAEDDEEVVEDDEELDEELDAALTMRLAESKLGLH